LILILLIFFVMLLSWNTSLTSYLILNYSWLSKLHDYHANSCHVDFLILFLHHFIL
jgi:hypothetical protein